MRNFSFDLSFSLQERVKTRERAISKTRDKISIDSKKQKKAKILFKRLLLLFKEEQKVSLVRSKIQKNSKRILQNRENNEKILRRRRSPLGRNSTHHFVVLIYINQSALKIKCSRLREEGLPLRNEDIEAFSEEEEMVLSPKLKKQTTF